jgi:hypothetical protein
MCQRNDSLTANRSALDHRGLWMSVPRDLPDPGRSRGALHFIDDEERVVFDEADGIILRGA